MIVEQAAEMDYQDDIVKLSEAQHDDMRNLLE